MSSVFSKIISGEIPGNFIWNDDICIAITTIAPIREGHILVIPKQEIDHWDDVPIEQTAHMMSVCQKLTKAIKKAFPSQRVGLMIAGLEVPHTHIHLMPIDDMGDMDFARAEMTNPDALKLVAEKIKAQL